MDEKKKKRLRMFKVKRNRGKQGKFFVISIIIYCFHSFFL